jgi:hypothetical protein
MVIIHLIFKYVILLTKELELIYNIQIDLYLRTQKMSQRWQTIVDQIKNSKYVPMDDDVSFGYYDISGNLDVHPTMHAEHSFTFDLMSD